MASRTSFAFCSKVLTLFERMSSTRSFSRSMSSSSSLRTRITGS